jgi:long-chain acyl-CoA synthetase
MRIEGFLERSARAFPDKVGLVVGERRVTYGELDDLANRLAHALLGAGLRRGDRVVLFLGNSVDAVVGLFGVLKASGVFSLVNPSTKPAKLAYIASHLEARFVITEAQLLEVAGEALADVPSVQRIFVADAAPPPGDARRAWLREAMEGPPGSPPRQAGIDLDLAYVSFTSGSTGRPKGVMMTHTSAVMGATTIAGYLGNTGEDVILSVIPLAFDYGLYQVLTCASFGGTLVLETSLAFPNQILRRMAREGVTGFPLVPTIAAILVGLRGLSPGDLPALRYLTNTAAPLPPAHSARLQELFPTAHIFSNYGLTENIRATYLPPEELARRPTSVGKAIPGTEAYIVDDNGDRVGPSVVGELVLRGANLLRGYWRDPEATDKALRPGPYPWERVLHTGDLFTADEDGFLYFVGRRDDIIKSRGEKVAPREVENVLYMLPGVCEAAVIGVPDPIQGMAIRAVLALSPGYLLTARDVQAHCARHLEDYMVPSSVEFRDELPKTESGKIRRRALQGEAALEGSRA